MIKSGFSASFFGVCVCVFCENLKGNTFGVKFSGILIFSFMCETVSAILVGLF